jgi:hypothetical protein
MTPTELRALDLFIAEKYLGNTAVPFNPTTDEFDSFVLLRKFGERFEMLEICIYKTPHCWWVFGRKGNKQATAMHHAPTLELAICLFAREVMK